MSEPARTAVTRSEPTRLDRAARCAVRVWIVLSLALPALTAWIMHPEGRRFLLEQFGIYAR